MRAVKKINLEKILFISIETVPQETELAKEGLMHNSWAERVDDSDSYTETAPLFAEFGKIFCVSLGYVKNHQLNIKTIQGDEKEIIETTYKMVDAFRRTWGNLTLCGHSLKGFAIPYVMRRSVINDISVHELFDVSGLKPWDINWILDIKDLWQGSSPVSAPLLSLAHAFNLDYAESTILGKDVASMYVHEEYEEIIHRCEVNVRICHDILKRMAGIKTDWKDEILANAELGTLEKAYNGVVSVKDIGDLKDKLSSMNLDPKATKDILDTMFKGDIPNELNGLF